MENPVEWSSREAPSERTPDSAGAALEPPAYRLIRVVRVLVFVGIGAAVGFSSGRTVYQLAGSDEQPATSESLLRHSARLGLLAGAFMGVIVGLAVVPGIEENVSRALSRRAVVSMALASLGGIALCVGAGAVFWVVWSALSGPGGQPPALAARYGGGATGGLLALALLWVASRWLRARIADAGPPLSAEPGAAADGPRL